jgi:hypothetical protein
MKIPALLCAAALACQTAAAVTLDLTSDGLIYRQYGSYADATALYYDLNNSFAGTNGWPTLTADFSSDKTLNVHFEAPGLSFEVNPAAGHATYFLVEFWIGDEQTGGFTTLDGATISFSGATGAVPLSLDYADNGKWYDEGTFYVTCKCTVTGSFGFTSFDVSIPVADDYDANIANATIHGFTGVYEEGYATDPGDTGLLIAVPEARHAAAAMAALALLAAVRRRRA